MRQNGSIPRGLRAAGVALALGLLAGVAPPASADDARVSDARFEEVRSALEARGYRDLRSAERDEDGHLDVDARNADGHDVDLELDAESLEILREERD